jgi:hypothetical protein
MRLSVVLRRIARIFPKRMWWQKRSPSHVSGAPDLLTGIKLTVNLFERAVTSL